MVLLYACVFSPRTCCKNCSSSQAKPTISPALETAIDYQLKILSVAISYGGPELLHYRDHFKEAIVSAFESPSWKVFFYLFINSFNYFSVIDIFIYKLNCAI